MNWQLVQGSLPLALELNCLTCYSSYISTVPEIVTAYVVCDRLKLLWKGECLEVDVQVVLDTFIDLSVSSGWSQAGQALIGSRWKQLLQPAEDHVTFLFLHFDKVIWTKLLSLLIGLCFLHLCIQ